MGRGADRSRRLVELSHRIEEGMVTYPGLPGPSFSAHLAREDSRSHYAPGTEFLIGRIDMLGNTGTYLDSPFHRYADGTDLAGLPLGSVADLPGVVVHAPGPAVSVAAFEGLDLAGRAVLVHTGWDEHWGTEAYGGPDHPFLDAAAVEWLVDAGAALVGIDSVNIDDTSGGERPAHSGLLAAEIPVVEHLCNLGDLPDEGFRFTAAPPMVAGFTTFPVRAFAVVET